MSVMDKLKQMLKGHEDQASKGVDKSGDMIDDRTQGKYKGHVDTAQDKLKDQFGGDQPGPGQNPPPAS
ncbi:antitoxin [Streptomyces sp. NBC_01619]|uniref:antitoxin n=1 Tax=unclassified Streptomyces TaxID=2593676 RepID=UPI0022512403|nr:MULTISPECIES: antitoxin [unclassified Streptomyces]MCX4511601.1 antitoxin [Streptomyces sp. NBC_01619]